MKSDKSYIFMGVMYFCFAMILTVFDNITSNIYINSNETFFMYMSYICGLFTFIAVIIGVCYILRPIKIWSILFKVSDEGGSNVQR